MLWKLQHFSAHLHRFDCCQHAKTEFDLQPRQNAFCLIECVRAVRVCACVWATGGVIEWVQASVIYIQLTVVCAHRTAIHLICTLYKYMYLSHARDTDARTWCHDSPLVPHKYSSQSDNLYQMRGGYNETRHSMLNRRSRSSPNKCILRNYGN